MILRLMRRIQKHEHWFAEWWSAILLIIVGIYAIIDPKSEIIHRSFIDGFLEFIPINIWEFLFISVGVLQLYSLLLESLFVRGIAAFCASVLLLWGSFNIFVYDQQWHFSLIVWGVFATINLYALERILSGVEVYHDNC